MDERREGLLDIVEQVFLLGLGAASLTKEKVEKTVDGLIERGRIDREEGRRLAEELTERGAEEKRAMSRALRDEVHKALEAGEIATKSDVRRLEAEIAEIRGHLGMPQREPGFVEVPEQRTTPELADTER